MAAFDTILAACKAAGVRVGVHTASVAYSQKMIERGFDLVTVGADTRYLQQRPARGRRDARLAGGRCARRSRRAVELPHSSATASKGYAWKLDRAKGRLQDVRKHSLACPAVVRGSEPMPNLIWPRALSPDVGASGLIGRTIHWLGVALAAGGPGHRPRLRGRRLVDADAAGLTLAAVAMALAARGVRYLLARE